MSNRAEVASRTVTLRYERAIEPTIAPKDAAARLLAQRGRRRGGRQSAPQPLEQIKVNFIAFQMGDHAPTPQSLAAAALSLSGLLPAAHAALIVGIFDLLP